MFNCREKSNYEDSPFGLTKNLIELWEDFTGEKFQRNSMDQSSQFYRVYLDEILPSNVLFRVNKRLIDPFNFKQYMYQVLIILPGTCEELKLNEDIPGLWFRVDQLKNKQYIAAQRILKAIYSYNATLPIENDIDMIFQMLQNNS